MPRSRNLPEHFALVRNILRIRVGVPVDLRDRLRPPYKGNRELVKSLGTGSLREGQQIERSSRVIDEVDGIIAGFLYIINEARPERKRQVWQSRPNRRLSIPDDLPAALAQQISTLIASAGVRVIERGGFGGEWADVPDVPEPTVANDKVSLDIAIADWKKKHGAWPDSDAGRKAEAKAERGKRRAAESLFAFAETTDMAAIDTLTIQKWSDGLDGRTAYDYVMDVKMLYRRLKAKHRLPVGMANPAADIENPTKPPHKGRDEFTDDRATMILESASRSDDPLIRWGVPIMADTGMIISEFVSAPTSEIKQIDGVWCWHVGATRALKTNNRPRVIPIPMLVERRFLDYVRSRGDGLLFSKSNMRASAALMAHLRSLGIEGADQVNYSWRHRFISTLVNNGTDPTLRNYLDGHGFAGIDEKHYIHHHMPQMVAAIRSLKDPR